VLRRRGRERRRRGEASAERACCTASARFGPCTSVVCGRTRGWHAVSVDQTLQSPGEGKGGGGDGGGAGAVTRAQRVLQRSDAGEWEAQGARCRRQALCGAQARLALRAGRPHLRVCFRGAKCGQCRKDRVHITRSDRTEGLGKERGRVASCSWEAAGVTRDYAQCERLARCGTERFAQCSARGVLGAV
jgi:hypothetical protein